MNIELRDYIKVITIPKVNINNLTNNYSFAIYEKELIIEAFKNFFGATELYYDEYDPNKVYYTVRFDNFKEDICFDINHVYHLFGLPTVKELSDFCDVSHCLDNNDDNNIRGEYRKTDDFIKFYTSLFKNYGNLLIQYDSQEKNKKLNWDKVSLKLFAFLNLGVFSEGKTYAFRNLSKNKKASTMQEYIFERKPLTKNVGVENTIRMELVENIDNGKRVLVPKSLRFESKLKEHKFYKDDYDGHICYRGYEDIIIEQTKL